MLPGTMNYLSKVNKKSQPNQVSLVATCEKITVCKKKNGRPVIYKFASLYIMGAIFSSHTVFITKLFSMSLQVRPCVNFYLRPDSLDLDKNDTKNQLSNGSRKSQSNQASLVPPSGKMIDHRMVFNVSISKTICQFSFETKFA